MGNEGAGTVVAAGDGEQAHKLMGQRVACVPGTAYSEYALAEAAMCLPLGDVSSEDGASAFVNPMTALGFVETARMEGQKAHRPCCRRIQSGPNAQPDMPGRRHGACQYRAQAGAGRSLEGRKVRNMS